VLEEVVIQLKTYGHPSRQGVEEIFEYFEEAMRASMPLLWERGILGLRMVI
jgi:hypothetical protein